MGLLVALDEETTECRIFLGDKVIQSYLMRHWRQSRDEAMNADPKNKSDYAE